LTYLRCWPKRPVARKADHAGAGDI
jgi:hypothetical protein